MIEGADSFSIDRAARLHLGAIRREPWRSPTDDPFPVLVVYFLLKEKQRMNTTRSMPECRLDGFLNKSVEAKIVHDLN